MSLQADHHVNNSDQQPKNPTLSLSVPDVHDHAYVLSPGGISPSPSPSSIDPSHSSLAQVVTFATRSPIVNDREPSKAARPGPPSRLNSLETRTVDPPVPLPPRRPIRTGHRELRQKLYSPNSDGRRRSFFETTKGFMRKNEYEYTNMPVGVQIRILQLNAGQGDETLRCTLVPATLHATYEALSYYWGTDESSNEIRIQNYDSRQPLSMLNIQEQKFYIRSNLFQALRALREPDRAVHLWVDAICINQEDDDEKKTQVAMMEDIYSKAKSVVIWLGEPTKQCPSNVAFDFVKKVCDLRSFDTLLAEEYLDDWEALAKLMRNVWFSRRWVVQELALAREAFLRSGKHMVHWDDFADAIAFYVLRFEKIKKMRRAVTLGPDDPDPLREVGKLGTIVLVDATSNLFRKDERGDIVEHRMTLEALISTLTAYEASDPRDTIYAVLSLAKDTKRDAPNRHNPSITSYASSDKSSNHEGDETNSDVDGLELVMRGQDSFSDLNLEHHGINPDYEKDLLEVCKDFVQSCVACSKSLDIICRHWAPIVKKFKYLSQQEVKKKMTLEQKNWVTNRKLPTWMPSIKGGPYGAPQDALSGRKHGDSLVGDPTRRYYNASFGIQTGDECVSFGTMQEEIKFFELRTSVKALNANNSAPPSPHPREVSDGTITVTGLSIDVVDDIGTRCVNGIITAESLAIGEWPQDDDENSEFAPELPDELWRTMVGDRGPDGTSAPRWYARACRHAIEESSDTGDINTVDLIEQERDSIVVEFLKRVRDVVWNRSFFRSSGGNFGSRKPRLGLAPAEAEKGDLICILYGCSVPVILREIKGERCLEYSLIGECYLHGMMDGEAISGLTKKQLLRAEKKFRLR